MYPRSGFRSGGTSAETTLLETTLLSTPKRVTGSQKGGFVKGWFGRTYPRSGFRSGGTSAETTLLETTLLQTPEKGPLGSLRRRSHVSKTSSEKVLGRVLEKACQKVACYGFTGLLLRRVATLPPC